MLLLNKTPGGVAKFDIDNLGAVMKLCQFLIEDSVSFYFEPQCFDESLVVVNADAAQRVQAHLDWIEATYNMGIS